MRKSRAGKPSTSITLSGREIPMYRTSMSAEPMVLIMNVRRRPIASHRNAPAREAGELNRRSARR